MITRNRAIVVSLIAALLVAGGLLFINREPIVLGYLASKAPATDLGARKALIAPSIQYFPPADGKPPYPVVLQFHGCAGIRQPFMEQWAKVANDAGYLAVIVDSMGPRGIDRETALELVCQGKQLLGQERAGDVLAAYELVKERDDIDQSKIVLAGWSHGGWSVMDLIALDPPRRMPAGIEDGGSGQVDPAGLITIYPYCGPGTWSKAIGWRQSPKTLALIAGADTVVDPKECPVVMSKLQEKGADIEMHVYDGIDHVFDDPFLDPEYQYYYDEKTHQDAEAKYRQFLETIAG